VNLPEVILTPWAWSARQYYKGRIVLLAQQPEEYDRLAKEYDIELRTAHLHRDNDKVGVWKYRWEEIASLLSRETNNPNVLLTDTRDVVFQRAPFREGSGLYAATEGRTFATCRWNNMRMQKYFPEHFAEAQTWPNICAGVIQGPATVLTTLARAVAKHLHGKPGEADQAAVNIELRKLGVETVPYSEAWACHLVQMSPLSFCFEAGVRSERLPALVGGRIVAGTTPFAVVHQWPVIRKRWTDEGFDG
jgi:hypothetical protein